MLTTIPVPSTVTYPKMFEWTQQTPFQEGVHIISYFQQATPHCNWVILYCWAYVRTKGFTDPCMKRWDLLNLGDNNATYSDGVKVATAELLKYPDTSMMDEQEEVEKLYKEICEFCAGIIYTPPPELPKPKPEPIPEPPPPKPEEPKPEEPGKPFSWGFLKWLLPALGALATVGSLFLPGWAKTLIDVILKVLSGLSS